MPDVPDEEALPSVTIGPRVNLRVDDFVGPVRMVPDPARPGATMGDWPALTKPTEDRVVAEIKQAHAEALFRRRRFRVRRSRGSPMSRTIRWIVPIASRT